MAKDMLVEGENLTHQTIWMTAQHFLEDGKTEPKGRFYPLLAAGVFAYFAFEAFLNEALRQVARDKWEQEAEFFSKGQFKGTPGKFDYLASLCGHSVDRSRRPFQTITNLGEARNFLVHARTETFDVRMSSTTVVSGSFRRPSAFDRYASIEFSSRALEDVEAVCNQLLLALRAKFPYIELGGPRGAFHGVSGSFHGTFLKPAAPPSDDA